MGDVVETGQLPGIGLAFSVLLTWMGSPSAKSLPD